MRTSPTRVALAVPLALLAAGATCIAAPVPAAPASAPAAAPAPPLGPAPGTSAIVPAADSIRIPFAMFRDDILLVGRMNGREVRMLVDNGALWDELLFFGSPRVDSLGIERTGTADVGGAGAGDPVLADYATGLDLAFDGEDGRTLLLGDQPAIVMPYDAGAPNPWEGSEGQVSAALFKRFVVELDFAGGIMTLTRPEAYDPQGRGTVLPMTPRPATGSWTIPGAVTLHDGRRLALDLTMDLGWDEDVAINLGQAHDIALPPNLERTALGFGAQGPIHGWRGTVPRVELAGVVFDDVPATYSTVEDGGSKVDEVMVGMGLLSRFRIAFDYPGRRVVLGPR